MSLLDPIYLEAPIETSAQEFRQGIAGVQEGVLAAGDLKVTAAAAMSVDVAAGVGFVQGDTVSDQGLYRTRNAAAANSGDAGAGAFEAGGISAANATNPRIDQIVLRIYDATHDGSGQRKGRFEVLTGTPTAGATLDNRSGAAALPSSALRLADVLIPAASASVSAGNIRDRRQWARGAFWRGIRSAGGNLSKADASLAEIDATNLKARIECSGVPLRCTLLGSISHTAADQNNPLFDLGIDGAGQGLAQVAHVSVSGGQLFTALQWSVVPAAGSHLVAPMWLRLNSGTLTLIQGAAGGGVNSNPVFTVEEIPRQNAANT
jgi:hypothetical protein